MLVVPSEARSQPTTFSSIPLSVFEPSQPAAAQERQVTFKNVPCCKAELLGGITSIHRNPVILGVVQQECPFTLFTDQRRWRNASLNSFGLDSAMPLSKSQQSLF